MLARGGMAVVYLVRQPALDREVVLKRLDLESDDPALAQRFVREARLAATLDHPNVVTLFDFFEHDGVPYIAMEYVARRVAAGARRAARPAADLRRRRGRARRARPRGAARHRAPRPQAGERAAHRARRREDRRLRDRARLQRADAAADAPGMAIGTPAYMAPEQAHERAARAVHGPLRARRDRLRAARRPPAVRSGHARRACSTATSTSRPPPLAGPRRPGHAAVCGWVQWLLAKDPAERPQSAARGVGRARGDRGRRAGPVLAADRDDHRAGAQRRGGRGRRRGTAHDGGGRRAGRRRRSRRTSCRTPTPLAPGRSAERRRPRRRAAWLAAALLAGAAAVVAALVAQRARDASASRRPIRPSGAPPRTTSTATAARSS